MTEKINYPTADFKSGHFSSAVFESERQNRQGKTYLKKSIKLQKSYLDPASEQWVNRGFTVFPGEIGDLESVLRKARDHCKLKSNVEDPK